MADASLRAELEKVYRAYYRALQTKDVEAFVKVVDLPTEVPVEGLAQEFGDFAAGTLEMTPDPAAITFVTVKTLDDDDVAGYYGRFTTPDQPETVNVMLTTFRRIGGAWKMCMSEATSSFQPKPGQDVHAQAMALVESSEILQLRPPEESGGPAPHCDRDLSGVLECWAYDCQLTIAINGVTLGYRGGSSYGLRLFGVAAGEEPGEPGLLRVGENRIEVTYRRTRTDTSPPEVSVHLPPAGCCFHLVAKKPEGTAAATFVIPRSPTEQLSPDEVTSVEVVDE
jgi:hypothetical protein